MQFRHLFLAALLLALTGCGVRNNLHYNPYAPPLDRPPLLEQGEKLIGAGETALDNLDRRIENAVY